MVIKKSFVLSSLIIAVLIYGKIIPLPKDHISSIIPSCNISRLEGIIISNPVKISDKYYSVKVQTFNTYTKDGIYSKSKGNTSILISSSEIEALYPKKLFSKSSGTNLILLEQYANVKLKVKYIDSDNKGFFLCEKIIATSYKDDFLSRIMKKRASVRIHFKRLMSEWGRAGGLFLALLSSSREYLEKEVSNAFKLSGLSHILALSGMHLSLVSSMSGIVEKKSALKKTGILIQLFLVFLFVWFAGFSPSLLRALISTVLGAGLRLFNVKNRNSLCVYLSTFLIHSAVSPSDITSIAFILSYGALGGILVLGPLVKNTITRWIPFRLSSALTASISANLVTAPIGITNFGIFSPSGIITTMIVSPLVSVFLYTGVFSFILCLIFPAFCVFCGYILNLIYDIIVMVIRFWSFIPPLYFD